VAEKRNRWLINVVLILSVVAFVGFSILPLLSSVLEQPKPQASATPSANPTARTPPKKEELESQAKGYESVLQREPDNQTALRGLLEAKLALGDVKGAIGPLEKLAKLNPNESDYSVLLAQAKQQVGDREGAAQTYRTILQTKPGDPKALEGLVTLLVKEQRPEAAISLLQDTIKSAPQSNQIQAGSVDVASVQLLLGSVYADQKRFDDAIALYNEAAKTNKEDFRPVLAKALVLKNQGKIEEAKPLFAAATNLAPASFKDQINQLATAPPSPSPGSTTPAPSPTPSPAASPKN
jgi:Flp pilus assembly protein TadD